MVGRLRAMMRAGGERGERLRKEDERTLVVVLVLGKCVELV